MPMDRTLDDPTRERFEKDLEAAGADAAQMRAWRRFFDAFQKGEFNLTLMDLVGCDVMPGIVTGWTPVCEPTKTEADRDQYMRDCRAQCQAEVDAGRWTAKTMEEQMRNYTTAFETLLSSRAPVPAPLRRSDRAIAQTLLRNPGGSWDKVLGHGRVPSKRVLAFARYARISHAEWRANKERQNGEVSEPQD